MSKDYRDFKEAGNTDDVTNKDVTGHRRDWWNSKDSMEMAQSITSTVVYLSTHQSARLTQYNNSVRLYGNMTLMGLNGLSFNKIMNQQTPQRDRVTYNLMMSVIDTITAKIAKNKPKPLFLTSGGDYKAQRKAKKLNKFIEGIFYETDAYTLGVEAFKDACIFGDGVIHVFEEDKKVKFERVIPSEMYVDEIEGFYGNPRQLHRIKAVDRQTAIAAYPEFKEQLLNVNAMNPDDTGKGQVISDLIIMCESWHLPSGKDAGDGKHVLIATNVVIFEEEWKREDFPFVFMKWSKRVYGFWGGSLCEQLQNIQTEINKILWVIQRSMHLAGSFKIFIENSSKIVKEHIDNGLGTIVSYTNNPPVYATPPIIQPEIYTQLERLIEKGYAVAGVSQLSAASKKPDGLDSGKALREFNDIESDRFNIVGKNYENLFLELGKKALKVAEKIGGITVRAPNKKIVEIISLKDCKLKDSEYVMQCYPISSLPQDPAGRLQTIQEYIQAGFIDQREGQRLLDFPDLDAIENLNSAMEDHFHGIFEKMVEDGEYTPPEPLDDLMLGKRLALMYYQKGKCQQLEEEKLELFRRFIEQCDTLVQESMPPMPMGAPVSPQLPVSPPQ